MKLLSCNLQTSKTNLDREVNQARGNKFFVIRKQFNVGVPAAANLR